MEDRREEAVTGTPISVIEAPSEVTGLKNERVSLSIRGAGHCCGARTKKRTRRVEVERT